MASESIVNLRKPDFPKFLNNERSKTVTIEYIGADTELVEPEVGDVWGDFEGTVSSVNKNPIHGTTPLLAEMTVTVESSYDQGDGEEEGEALEISYEVEWVMFQRSMYEHPAFAVGGGGTYALTGGDIAAIEVWKNEPDVGLKSAYQYLPSPDAAEHEYLSANAIKFVNGIELGIESYEDYAPLVRKNTIYGKGLPATSTAGQKEDAPDITGKPEGYEWRKQADRATSNGKRKWDRSEEWIGAIRVLVDKDEIFW